MGAPAEQFPMPGLMAQVPRLVSLPGQPFREHRILNKRVLIGTDGKADFVLLDPTISGRHATITKRRASYVLTDLGSERGTFVNGKRIAPKVEHLLSSADDVQFGNLHFTFLLPEGSYDALRGALHRRMRVEAVVTILLLVSIVLSYIVPRSFWESLIPHRVPRPTFGEAIDTWLSTLNRYRQASGLAPVTEANALSSADEKHARYLVANQADVIRTGKIGASIHDEDPARPYFTQEGKTAGALSDVDAVYSDPPETPEVSWAIDNWITGPFHRMWLLNPALRQVGYGQFCEKGICAAALNIQSGIEADPEATAPVMYPPDGATIRNGKFSVEESEWPDPLATCDYRTPTGMPITLQIGGSAPAGLEEYSLSRNGVSVASCAFDASSYRSSDAVAKQRVKSQLAHFAAIVMVPKEPLVPGATYRVKITASGQNFSWWFAVEP
jgi:FHA domain-containing protein/cysteine-rich secretory family protein